MNVFPRAERFLFFSKVLNIKSWKGLKVLDYGGNRGNLLYGADITHTDYTCIDVDKDGLLIGSQDFPEANWVHYDRFNQMYNPFGTIQEIFPLPDNYFDIVCAYSVHSHSSYEDFVFDLNEMKRVVKPNGRIATTVVDIDTAKYFVEKRIRDYGSASNIDELKTPSYIYYIDNDTVSTTIPTMVNFLVTVYNLQWLSKEHNLEIVKIQNHQPALIIQDT